MSFELGASNNGKLISSSSLTPFDCSSFSNSTTNATVTTLSSNTTPIISQKRSQRRLSTSSTSCSSSSSSTNSKQQHTIGNSDNILINSLPSPTATTNTPVSNIGLQQMTSSIVTNSASFKVVVPKSPKPQRTLAVLEHVSLGLNLSVNDLKTKVADLTSAVTNGYNAMAKQLLHSESYLRHLEQRINTLNKLENSYNVHLKMKDGIQNMFDAYKKSPGNQNKNISNIKNGWKDCIQKLCAIEAQTEALLGTFQFQIEKLIGFARLCPGDTYEVLIKYGNSAKFKTRTKILKDNSQHWENTKFAFKITVHDLLLIRINEIKFLGKNVLIGERLFDTNDLFSTTQTQRLTLNANTSGTLKLSMLITWLPFENCEESFIYYNPTQYLTLGNKHRLSSYTMTKLTNNTTSNKNFSDTNLLKLQSSESSQSIADCSMNRFNNLLTAIMDTDDVESSHSSCGGPAINSTSSSSSTSTSSSSSSASSAKKSLIQDVTDQDPPFSPSPSPSSPALADTALANLSTSLNSVSSNDSNNKQSLDAFPCDENDDNYDCDKFIVHEVEAVLAQLVDGLVENQELNHRKKLNLMLVEESLVKLQIKLDELRAQYIELNEFYEQVQKYENLIHKLKMSSKKEDTTVSTDNLSSASNDSHSNTSLNLDDLMQYFDFLNEENEKLDKDLRINLPDDFCLFLRNWFAKCLNLIEDLNDLSKTQQETSLKLNQFESVLFEKLNAETNLLKQFYTLLYDLNEKDSNSSILNRILTDESKLNKWLTLTKNQILLNISNTSVLTNAAFSNVKTMPLLANKLLNKITHHSNNQSFNVYQFLTMLELFDQLAILNENDNLIKIDNISLDRLLDNRVYSSTILSFLLDLAIGDNGHSIQIESLIKKMRALSPTKTADTWITLTWEAVSESSSEDYLKLIVSYLKLINENELQPGSTPIIDQSLIDFLHKQIEALNETSYYMF